MKFSDLFLPKIARSDPEVRKEAIRNETNVQLLQNVIQKDSDPDVRNLASQRLSELTADQEA